MMTSRRAALVSLAAVLLATLALSPSIATAKDKPEPLGVPVNCVQLATDPAVGLAGNPVIKAATSTLIPASGVNKAYCRVDVLYGTSQEQNINIRAGLPLNSLDGGTGGIQGAWNGRTQGVGGGGCAGNVNVTAPVNAGYVGSGTETGPRTEKHTAGPPSQSNLVSRPPPGKKKRPACDNKTRQM